MGKDEVLIRYHEIDPIMKTVFCTAIAECILPMNPEDIRLSAVEVIRRMFLLYGRLRKPVGSVLKGRILSFTERNKLYEQDHVNDTIRNEDSKVLFNNGIKMLLDLLEDSSDQVRLEAIESLWYTLPFICEEVNQQETVKSSIEGQSDLSMIT